MQLKKARAGSTSHGHVWETDGQVLEVPDADGAELLKIPDGGFSEVTPTAPPADPDVADDTDDDQADGDDGQDGDHGREDRTPIDEAPKPPARRGRPAGARKAKADAGDKTVEE
jgi:hypothetical protein